MKLIAAQVSRLSKLFTREREAFPASYLKDAGLREAYLLYFLPINMNKIHIPLMEISLHPAEVFARKILRVLDLGSGPGTASLGTLDFFSKLNNGPSLEFTAVDPIAENLREAEKLFKPFAEKQSAKASLITVTSSVERMKALPEDPFDIIILSNLLSEIRPNDPDRITRRTGLLIKLLKKSLAHDGSCIIIEPALRVTSRELLAVRDSLVNEGLHIYSPCLMDAPCPALLDPKDWCHEDVPWDPPAIIRQIDRLTGLRKDSLKFSYLVIRKDQLSISDIFSGDCFRVVSEPLISKGKIEFYLCSDKGRRLAIRLDRDKTPINDPFEKMRRGMIISLENVIDQGTRLRIGKETSVALLLRSQGERWDCSP